MANEKVRVITMDGTKSPDSTKKTGSFKPSTPAGYVRPKPVPVPAKAK